MTAGSWPTAWDGGNWVRPMAPHRSMRALRATAAAAALWASAGRGEEEGRAIPPRPPRIPAALRLEDALRVLAVRPQQPAATGGAGTPASGRSIAAI